MSNEGPSGPALGVRSLALVVWLLAGAVVAPIALAATIGADGAYAPVLLTATATFSAAFLAAAIPTLVFFAVYMLFVGSLEWYAGTGVVQVDELVIAVFVVVTVVRNRSDILPRTSLPREAAVVALVVLGAASSVVNDVPLHVWAPGLLLLGKGIAFFYVVLAQRVSDRQVRRMGQVIVVLSLLVLAGALIELVAPQLLTSLGVSAGSRPRGELPSVKSFFVHPVLFAWFTAFVAIYLFTGFAMMRRWWMLVVATLLSAGTVLAARRRAMIALGVAVASGLGWDVLRAPTRWRGAAARWALQLVSLALLAAIFLPSLSQLYVSTIERYVPVPSADVVQPRPPQDEGDVGSVDNATPARAALYVGSVAVANDHFPLGAGLGRYGSWMSRVEYSPLYVEYGLSHVYGLRPANPIFATDTFWPQVTGELGWLGLAGYAVFLASIGLGLWRESRRAWASELMRTVCVATLLVFVQALVESLASAMFHSPPRAYLTFGAFAVVLAAAHSARSSAVQGVVAARTLAERAA